MAQRNGAGSARSDAPGLAGYRKARQAAVASLDLIGAVEPTLFQPPICAVTLVFPPCTPRICIGVWG
jgi:hypothetical protein